MYIDYGYDSYKHVYIGPYRLVPDKYECWGYKYKPWDDSDRDAIKTMHEIETPDGKMIRGPWSPYKTPTVGEFHEFIDEFAGVVSGELYKKEKGRPWHHRLST